MQPFLGYTGSRGLQVQPAFVPLASEQMDEAERRAHHAEALHVLFQLADRDNSQHVDPIELEHDFEASWVANKGGIESRD